MAKLTCSMVNLHCFVVEVTLIRAVDEEYPIKKHEIGVTKAFSLRKKIKPAGLIRGVPKHPAK